MKNQNIATILKYYRKLNKLSVNDVSKSLSHDDIFVAEKTIYGWESGHTQPDADTLLKLCDIYKIPDILKTFGYEKNESQVRLTDFELKLIIKYREHPQMQESIKKLLDM
ncbi:MAG: helix-turn-helix transcriptional regulator [Lachnospiraceae bacterium]|nr:helix-turn-helix transcriptional regulator [Lachnospiraceae bacterium]